VEKEELKVKTEVSGKTLVSEVSVNSPGNRWSQSCRGKGRLQWEGCAGKGGLKPGMVNI